MLPVSLNKGILLYIKHGLAILLSGNKTKPREFTALSGKGCSQLFPVKHSSVSLVQLLLPDTVAFYITLTISVVTSRSKLIIQLYVYFAKLEKTDLKGSLDHLRCSRILTHWLCF